MVLSNIPYNHQKLAEAITCYRLFSWGSDSTSIPTISPLSPDCCRRPLFLPHMKWGQADLSPCSGLQNLIQSPALITCHQNSPYPRIHTTRLSSTYCHIRGALHNNVPRFLGFRFCRKLTHTKTQQGTYKSSEHNRHTFLRDLVLLVSASTGVVSTLSY